MHCSVERGCRGLTAYPTPPYLGVPISYADCAILQAAVGGSPGCTGSRSILLLVYRADRAATVGHEGPQ